MVESILKLIQREEKLECGDTAAVHTWSQSVTKLGLKFTKAAQRIKILQISLLRQLEQSRIRF